MPFWRKSSGSSVKGFERRNIKVYLCIQGIEIPDPLHSHNSLKICRNFKSRYMHDT